jgi:hypothetical protein
LRYTEEEKNIYRWSILPSTKIKAVCW